mmetsp:Transcript_5037/g.10928  ORF Transcript_5037/g.10928 Transcript_5037/m.10928 type:complete len:278 (+) Transcript_5037:535-1368(+)
MRGAWFTRSTSPGQPPYSDPCQPCMQLPSIYAAPYKNANPSLRPIRQGPGQDHLNEAQRDEDDVEGEGEAKRAGQLGVEAKHRQHKHNAAKQRVVGGDIVGDLDSVALEDMEDAEEQLLGTPCGAVHGTDHPLAPPGDADGKAAARVGDAEGDPLMVLARHHLEQEWAQGLICHVGEDVTQGGTQGYGLGELEAQGSYHCSDSCGKALQSVLHLCRVCRLHEDSYLACEELLLIQLLHIGDPIFVFVNQVVFVRCCLCDLVLSVERDDRILGTVPTA